MICEVLLNKDLSLNKMAWYGEFKKDLLLYMRLHHTFFSIFYASKYQSLTQLKRIFILLTVQFFTFSWVLMLTYTSMANGDYSTLKVLNQVVLFIFSLLASIFETILVQVSICSCVEYSGNKTRTSCHKFGSCCFWFSFVVVLFLLFGNIGGVIEDYQRENFDDYDVDTAGFAIVLVVRYFLTQFESMFIIDILKHFYTFNKTWKLQTGKYDRNNNDKSNTIVVGMNNDETNQQLILNGGCCGCKKMKYIIDVNGNVIGTIKNEFSITFVEYQCYINQQPLPQRDFQRVVKSIGSSMDIMSMTNNAQNIDTTQTVIDPADMQIADQ